MSAPVQAGQSAAEALRALRRQIETAARSAERDPKSVELMAVSKTLSIDAIAPFIKAGHDRFGENRVQEAKSKWPTLRQIASPAPIRLHLIGPLQTNKARDAVACFDVIETVDRPKIARALKAQMDAQNRPLPVLVQVNVGEEPQKAGCTPADTETFVAFCQREVGLDVRGLMAIPPFHEPPAPHFALVDTLADRCALPVRSFGMSHDYACAISQGATRIRIGSALFGPRDPAKP